MEQRVRVNDGTGVASRLIPIDHLNVTATSIGTAQILATVRDPVALQVERLAAINTTGSAATISLHSVPPGDSAATANTELAAVSIPANTAADLTDFIGGFYVTGTTLEAFSGTSGAIVIHGWAREVL